MAAMARAVWRSVGELTLSTLKHHSGYELVVVGHSLGAGTAGLLTILLYSLRQAPQAALPPPPPAAVRIRGFCFAPPPVFAPFSAAPPGAIDAISAFVYADDCVPFLSVRAGREMFAAMHGIDEVARTMASTEVLLTAAGRSPASDELATQAYERVATLADLNAAPELLMPAATFLWMRSTSMGAFDVVECNTTAVAEAVIGGIPLGVKMLADHMTDKYETALDTLVNREPLDAVRKAA